MGSSDDGCEEIAGTINKTYVAVCHGDIASVDGDAVVNAANNQLWMGSGVAGALKRAGGPEIEREAMSKGPIEVGDAVSTTAGNLLAKRVIHAAVMGQDLRTSGETIRRATLRSLEVARDEGLRTIALPAFGTGVGGFPLDECARQMMSAVSEFATRDTSICRVSFVLFDSRAFETFRTVVIEALGEA